MAQRVSHMDDGRPGGQALFTLFAAQLLPFAVRNHNDQGEALFCGNMPQGYRRAVRLKVGVAWFED